MLSLSHNFPFELNSRTRELGFHIIKDHYATTVDVGKYNLKQYINEIFQNTD